MEFSAIPGYDRALKRGRILEQRAREFPFLGACDRIYDVPVLPLTLRMFLELDHARSPFLIGGKPGVADVAVFLWRLSPDYARARSRGYSLGAARRRYVQKIRRIEYRPAVRQINRFLDRMLMDRPPSRIRQSEEASSDVSMAASFIHTIASVYSWPASEILDTPMPALFQYVRQIQRDRVEVAGKKLPLLNPLQSRLTKPFRERARAAAAAAKTP